MLHRIRLTDEARRQIETISDYIAIDSPTNAKRWLANLQVRIDTLKNLPESHAILYPAEIAGVDVRQTFYGVYRILYSIDKDIVHIPTVRHGAQADRTR